MGPRVLIADDDRAIRESLYRALELARYEVSSAADGVEALTAIRKEPPDIAILDVMMPGVDGLGVCRVVRADGSALPILMLTARVEVGGSVLPVAFPDPARLVPREPVLPLGGTRRAVPTLHRCDRGGGHRSPDAPASRDQGPHRGAVRTYAPGCAHPAQGAVDGIRHRHRPDAVPAAGPRAATG